MASSENIRSRPVVLVRECPQSCDQSQRPDHLPASGHSLCGPDPDQPVSSIKAATPETSEADEAGAVVSVDGSDQEQPERDPVPANGREAVGLHVSQQPLDRDEGDDRRDDEAYAESGSVFFGDMTRLVEVEGLVGGGCEHRRDADQE